MSSVFVYEYLVLVLICVSLSVAAHDVPSSSRMLTRSTEQSSHSNGSRTRWREAIYLSYPRATPSTLEAALQRRRNTKTTHPPRPFLFWGVYVYVHNTRGEESGGNGTIPNAPALSLAEGFPKRNPTPTTPSLYQHPLFLSPQFIHSSLRSRSGEIMAENSPSDQPS